MSSKPVFSYAQAAKGLPQSNTQPSTKDQRTEQGANTRQQEENSTPSETGRLSKSTATEDSKEAEDVVKNELTPVSEETTGETQSSPPTQQSRHQSETSKASISGATSPNMEASVSLTKEDDSAGDHERVSSWDQASHTSGTVEKEADGTEKEKVKDSEDDWEKVSVPSVTTDKELKAAPIPTVNIWKQRQEAQNAKRRQSETQRVPTQIASTTATKSKPAADETRTKPGSRETPEKGTAPPNRKGTDHERNREAVTSPSQTSRPTSRHGAKSESNVPPPVVDSTSWPTPENSIVEDRRRSNANEKPDKLEKTESRSTGNKTHGKWVQIPFVPTAKFETPLPPAASKRGGRAGRGRDGQGRGSHAGQNTDRSEQTGNMGPPPVPNKSNEQDRGRKADSDRATRANSLPTENRRPSSHGSNTANLRKPTAAVKDNSAVHTPVSSSKVSSTDPRSAKSPDQSRSSSRHEPNIPPPIPLPAPESIPTQQGEASSDIFTGPPSGANGRPNHFSDRSRTQGSGFRPPSEYTREGRSQKSRDWSRDKSDSVKEKVENWKDRDFSGESSGRRGDRSERGRGSYRGRGSHSYSSYQASHAYTSPLPQNGFDVPKHNAATPDRSRQTSQPFYSAAPPRGNNPRSQSIPLGGAYPTYFDTVSGIPQALSPIQTEMPGYTMAGQMPMLTGSVSAMPFNNHLSSYAVLSMVMSQVEYYFSIDNLCKDLFLRKHMDSQGWVPLSVVAGFKRIRTLTEDSMTLDILRYVCQQVKTVEYLPPGEDGEDRLRRREGWQDFILPMNERLPSAQNDGPYLRHTVMAQPPVMPQYAEESMTFVPQQVRRPSSGMMGANGMHSPTISSPPPPIPSMDGQVADAQSGGPYSPLPHEEVRRGSAVSPLSQEHSGLRTSPQMFRHGGRAGMINGHQRQPSRNLQEESMFPDEQIAEINICVKDPPQELKGHENASLPGVARVLSHESQQSTEGAAVTIPSHIASIRGGAANPDQLARLQHVQFGSQSNETSESTSFFAKDGRQTSLPPAQPGQYFIPYTIFHENALQDRERGMSGATEPMYTFWETFLVDKFNVGMYEEFKSLASEDSLQGDDAGTQHLLNYYQNVLKSPYPMVERVASDLVAHLRQEEAKVRPVFKMMRLAWRNGALDMKTRKRIADLLTEEEKAEFDKGG